MVGKTIRDGRFRSLYNAVVLAVARHGERVTGKIGDIVLRAGDTLLLEAHPSFHQEQSVAGAEHDVADSPRTSARPPCRWPFSWGWSLSSPSANPWER